MVQSTKTLLPNNLITHVKCKANGNHLEMIKRSYIFQPDWFEQNLIQSNLRKSKWNKIAVFSRTNKDVWLEKRIAIGNLEIV